MIDTNTYIRKPLYVEGVQVTEENFYELALWCQGEIIKPPDQKEHYIQVRVTNPMNPRQAQARVGDWILTSDRGYKIYTPKAFARAFDKLELDSHVATGARQLFENDTPPVKVVEDPAEIAATLHQEAKEGQITAEEADAAIIATPLEPIKPAPVGSGPMPKQPEPTDVEVKHVPAVPVNMKEGADENVVYPERPIHKDLIEELPEEELQQIDEELLKLDRGTP